MLVRYPVFLAMIISLGLVGCGDDGGSKSVIIIAMDAGAGTGDGALAMDSSTIEDGGMADATADSAVADAALPPDAGNAMLYSIPNEQVACQPNASFQALLPILNGGRTHPTGRGEQSSAYDPCNRRIILFGGNDFQPEECADFGPKRFQGDTWIYSLEHDNWARLDLDVAPSARGRHRMVFDRSRKKVYLFGGRFRQQMNSGSYTVFDDLWSFDVNTDTWSVLQTSGEPPNARSNTAMVYDHVNDRVILFGGSTSTSGLNFSPLSDTYILDIDSLVWRRVQGNNVPTRRLFHDMVIDAAHGKAFILGGGDENAFTGPFYADAWAFDLTEETWEQVWDGRGTGPDARINPALVEDTEGGRIILFGGHDDTRVGHRNDVWAFDYATRRWTALQDGDNGAGAGCSSFCDCPPNFVEVDINSPERRQYHTFQNILGESRAILFGGKGDCGYLDDTWSFGYTAGAWDEIEPAGQGEACSRTGQEGCTDLCY
jgi:hypothetical protein